MNSKKKKKKKNFTIALIFKFIDLHVSQRVPCAVTRSAR